MLSELELMCGQPGWTALTDIVHWRGSGQERVNFCSSKERAWLGPEGYSIPPHIVPGIGEKECLPGVPSV